MAYFTVEEMIEELKNYPKDSLVKIDCGDCDLESGDLFLIEGNVEGDKVVRICGDF